MPRPLKWGILGASTIILSKDIDKYAFMCGSNFYKTDVNWVVTDLFDLIDPIDLMNLVKLMPLVDIVDLLDFMDELWTSFDKQFMNRMTFEWLF